MESLGHGAEDRGQKEIRSQRSEVREQKSEIRGRRSEDRRQKTISNCGLRIEVRCQVSGIGRQKKLIAESSQSLKSWTG